VYVLTKEEGGSTRIFQWIQASVLFQDDRCNRSDKLPEGVEMVMPGDNVNLTAELIAPIAMEEGLRFAIREGGRTVGAGVVTEVLE